MKVGRKHILVMVLVAGGLMLLAIGMSARADERTADERCEILARDNEGLAKFRDGDDTWASVWSAVRRLQSGTALDAEIEDVLWVYLLTMAILVHRDVTPSKIYQQTRDFCQETGWG